MSTSAQVVLPPRASDRPLAVASLIFANLAMSLILLPFAEYANRFVGIGWPIRCCGGLMFGQAMWFFLWLTYSRSSLGYRAALAAIIGPLFGSGYVVGTWCGKMPPRYWHLFFQADLQQLENIKFATIGFWMLAWLTLILLLPAKRVRGVSLGCPAPAIVPTRNSRQFRILDLMLWTCVVIVPLGFMRVFLVQYLAEMFFQILLMAGFGIAFGLPVFRAAFAEQRPALWLLVLVVYAVALITGMNAFYHIQNMYFSRGAAPPFGESFYVAGLACLVVYANCWALRGLGMRWLTTPKKEGRSSAAEPHFTTIAPQPSNVTP